MRDMKVKTEGKVAAPYSGKRLISAKRLYPIAAGLALSLAGCTPTQIETAQSYQDKIAGACAVAMAASVYLSAVAPWIVGGCATEAAIAKLALDPTSLTWLKGLVK